MRLRKRLQTLHRALRLYTIDQVTLKKYTRFREYSPQYGSKSKTSQFAVCPAYQNSIQLIELYEHPAHMNIFN